MCLRRWRELDLPIYPSWPKEGGVEDVETISGHDDFDIFRRFKAVELIEEFQHRALNFGVASTAPLDPGRTDAVDLVHENDARGVLACHDEQLADHAAAFADVFLHQLGAGDADKLAGCVMRDGSCEQCFACTGWPVEEDAFRLCYAERLEEFGVFEA